MAFRLPVVDFNYRVVLFVLIFTIPALGIGSFFVVGIGEAELRRTFGRQLTQLAERTAAATDVYVFRAVVDMTRLATVPAVRDVAGAASEEQPDPDRVLQLDSQWQLESGPPPALIGPMDNVATRFLREVVAGDPVYREILLTDRHGRLVAASGISTDYYQGDETWWRDVADTGRLWVGDVVYDESARAFGLEIATPVFSGQSAGAIVGIMKVVVDNRELLAAVSGVPGEGTAEATLVRRDGSVVFSRQSVDPDAEYYAAALLREHLSAFRPGDPAAQVAYTARSSDGTDQMVAIAQTQLAGSFPNLPWVAAVSAPEAELLEPVRNQRRNLALVLALVPAILFALLLWLSTGTRGPSV